MRRQACTKKVRPCGACGECAEPPCDPRISFMLHMRTKTCAAQQPISVWPVWTQTKKNQRGSTMARLARTIADLARYRRAFDSALGRAKPQAAAAAPPTRLREV